MTSNNFDGENKNPLIGANIIIEDSDQGSASDINGTYLISDIRVCSTCTYNIKVLYIGYEEYTASILINMDKDYILNSNERFSIGVEHYTTNNIPLRFGVEYQTSPFKPYITSTSSFSLGSGYQINNFIFDIGLKFSQIQYNFPDLFPVIEELPLNTILEEAPTLPDVPVT